MKCKFCGNERSLIKAHIIPAGFFRRLYRQDKLSLEMLTNKEGERKKRVPIGVYDKTIVCKSCEIIWQEWDQYAQQLLSTTPLKGREHYIGGKLACYVVNDYDYNKLKLFFISILWRASVSNNNFYSRISLGQFENIAKKHIENSNPGTKEDFSVVVSKFTHPLAKNMLDPYLYQKSRVDYARFYFADYVADIKVDNKPTPNLVSKLSIAENMPLYIICKKFESSQELTIAKDIMRQSKEGESRR